MDFQTLSTIVILSGLVITAGFIVLIPDWRLASFALIAQYVIVTALLTMVMPIQIAIVRALSGGWAMIILYLTLRQKADAYRRALVASTDAPAPTPVSVFVVGFPFRLFALALIAVAIIGNASALSFLGLAPDVLFGGIWLMAAGVLVSILSRDVLRLGLGILGIWWGIFTVTWSAAAIVVIYVSWILKKLQREIITV